MSDYAVRETEKAVDRAAKRLLGLDGINPRIVQVVIREEFGNILECIPNPGPWVWERMKVLMKQGWKAGQEEKTEEEAPQPEEHHHDPKWWREKFPGLSQVEQDAALRKVTKSTCVFCRRAFFLGFKK